LKVIWDVAGGTKNTKWMYDWNRIGIDYMNDTRE
jgi:hypothetical protein